MPRRREVAEILQQTVQQLSQNDPSLTSVALGWEDLPLDDPVLLQRCLDALRLHSSVQYVVLRHIHAPQAATTKQKRHWPWTKHTQSTPNASTMLASTLRNHPSLRSLALQDCDDTDEGSLAHGLAIALSINPNIYSLQCSNCWHSKTSQDDLSFLSHLLLQARHVTSLTFQHNTLSATAVRRMATCFQPCLQKLDLTGNGLTDEAIANLCRAHQLRTIQCLVLDFNSFGNDGVHHLANMLQHSKTSSLEELHLFGNHVTSTGAQDLACALRTNTRLKSLVLSLNQIGDDGAVALAQALTVNSTLTKMCFPSNHIGTVGMMSLAEHLPSMKGLEQLNLGLLLHEEVAKALAQAMQTNVYLSVLHMEQVMGDEDETTTSRMTDFYLRLNRSGRRLLSMQPQRDAPSRQDRNARPYKQHHRSKPRPCIPLGLWPHILANSSKYNSPDGSPDVLYYWLRAKPEILDVASRR